MEQVKNATIWNRNFICAVLSNLLLCLGHFAVNQYVVSYAIYLGAGTALTGFLSGMFFGVALAIRPISGPMITKLDKRMLLIGVFALGAVAQLGYALFPSIPMFVVFRFVNGAQYSFVGSLIMTRVGDSLPPEKMVSGVGIYGVGGAIGMSLAPVIGTAILSFGTERFGELIGYRMLFFYAMIVMLVGMVPSIISTSDTKTKADVDSVGKWYENIVTVHAIPIAFSMLFSVMAYSVFNAYIVEFAKERGIPNASMFFTVMAVVLLVCRPTMGMLTDKFGVKRIVFPAMVLFASSFIIVGFANTLPMLLFAAVITALGYGASQPTIQALAMRVVPPLRRGVASNTIYIGIDLGFFVGPVVGGLIIQSTGDYGSMFKAFIAPAVIALGVLIAILPKIERRIKELGS